MADEQDINKQYSYKANSNLVLPQSGRRRPRTKDTGEPSALKIGSIDGRMGDRAGGRDDDGGSKDPVLQKRLSKLRRKPPASSVSRGAGSGLSSDRPTESGALDIVDTADKLQLDAGGVGYVPTTPVSQKAYEGLLAFVVSKMGDQPGEVLKSAAEDALVVLKDPGLREMEKKETICDALGVSMTEDEFARLSTFGRTIADFGGEEEGAGGSDADMDDDVDEGVAAIIEGDEDSDLPDEVENVEGDGEGVGGAPVLRPDDDGEVASDDENAAEAAGPTPDFSASIPVASSTTPLRRKPKKSPNITLDPFEIDGYWIQRRLSVHYSDAQECQQMAERVLATLADASDTASCENALMILFDFEHVEFVKTVLTHRSVVVFCTQLARATTPTEREGVEGRMRETEEGRSLLEMLAGEGGAGDEGAARKRPRKRRRHAEAGGGAEEGGEGRSSRKPRMALRKIDLDDIVFPQGNHLLSSKNLPLPPGSERIEYKDYEEWHIPASVAEKDAGARLPIASMPAWSQAAFRSTSQLNQLQTAVYPSAFEADGNLLICAPTGAGKTNVAVLTILRAFYNSAGGGKGMEEFGVGDADLKAFKVVYVAPMKALVSEVVTKLGGCLKEFGVSVRELTGDVNLTKREIDSTQVIVTTPEKWDVITRKSGERTFTSLVRLLIIDEIHLLHDERGPVLEAIIARTMRSIETSRTETRMVGLSATLPNYRDVASLLQVDEDKGLFYFDGSYRPSPLQQCYVGVSAKRAMKRFKIMNDVTYQKTKDQVVADNPVIVFVHSRKETVSTARYVVDRAIEDESIGHFMKHESDAYATIQGELGDVDSGELRSLLPRGVGTHHAGMSRKDRMLVEGLFENRIIKVLVSTATLAWGVNLPAHAVIIKGTQVYSPEKGRWVELSPMDVMQMMGRAGRPQYDKFGEGFIITTRPEVQFYLSLLNQQLPIESHLISRIVDLLNAEIATGCVSSIEDGAKWLTYTYLFVRMTRNPSLYNVSADERQADPTLERRRMELIHSAAIVLSRAKLITYNRKSGQVAATDLGRIASDFYVGHRTMGVYVENVHAAMQDIDLLRVFSLSGEFKHMRVREEEKLEVARLAEIVPIPVKEALTEASAKVNVLLQAYISNIRLDGLVLKSDMVYITQNASRLSRALLQVIVQRRWAGLADKCLRLCKMVDKKQWGSQTPLRQFSGTVGDEIVRKVERKYVDFERYFGLSSAEIGEMLRDPKMGRRVHQLVHSIPRMHMEVAVRPITRSTLEVECVLKADFAFRSVHGAGENFWVFVEDADSERLLYAENFYLRKAVAKESHTLVFSVQVTMPRPPVYFVKCCSDQWIGPDTVVPISFQHLILPERFAAHTEFLNLRPLGVSKCLTLDDSKDAFDREACDETVGVLCEYYKKAVRRNFGSLVTQLVPAVFKSASNALVATFPGVDRTIAGELAIGRLFCLQPASVAVWVCARADEVSVVSKRLSDGLCGALGLTVARLAGEHAADVATLKARGSVVVSSPQHFDALSRKWRGKRERRALRGVGLVVLDGVHAVGEGDAGTVVEVVGSRMRYLAGQIWGEGENTCRIVGLSDPVANAGDVGEWLDVPRECLVSFAPGDLPGCPNVEVVPCVARAGGGALSSPAALSRRILDAVRRRDEDVQVVVFVPNRKMARGMGLELVAVAPGEGGNNGFLRTERSVVEPHVEKVRLGSLRECLQGGVGFLHEGLGDGDRKVAEAMFSSGAVRVLVTTSGYARRSDAVKGGLVVVAGTATEEAGGFSVRRAEYSKSDVTRMVCCAVANSRGDAGTCVILTEASLADNYRTQSLSPTPLESRLTDVLADQINAEVASGVIDTKENVVHYLTWTFFYRRLPKNPNYYGMGGTSHLEISSFLSDVVEGALSDLRDAKCVDAEGEEDMELGALNLGIIAAHYYIRHATVERFAGMVGPKMKLRGLLSILSYAEEFDGVPARIGDEEAMERLVEVVPVGLKKVGGVAPSLSSLNVKVHLLLQSHLSRVSLAGDLMDDREKVVRGSVRLLRAMVDIISSAGWLEPALVCMELSQRVVQAVWDTERPLLALPWFEEGLVKSLEEKYDVKDVGDFLDMEAPTRKEAIGGLSQKQVREVADACGTYPDISWEVAEPVYDGEDVVLGVEIERLSDEREGVCAPRFPGGKSEGWWVVVGDAERNVLVTVKHVSFGGKTSVKLRFSRPEAPAGGEVKLTAYLVSDCYVDCDLEEVVVVKGAEGGGSGGDEDEIVPT